MRSSAAASGLLHSPRRRRKASCSPENEDNKSHEDGPRRIPLACGHCRTRKIKCDGAEGTCANCVSSKSLCIYVKVTAEQNAMAKAKKQTSRIAKGSKRVNDGPLKRESAKKRSIAAPSPPTSPSTSHSDSIGSPSSTYAPSPLVEETKWQSPASPPTRAPTRGHDARVVPVVLKADHAHAQSCACCPSEQHVPDQYYHRGPRAAVVPASEPASPDSSGWSSPQPWRAQQYEEAPQQPQHAQWSPNSQNSFSFPQNRYQHDQPGWSTLPEARTPPEEEPYGAYQHAPSSRLPHSQPPPIALIPYNSSYNSNSNRHVQQQPTPPFEYRSSEAAYGFDSYQESSMSGSLNHHHEAEAYHQFHSGFSFTVDHESAISPALSPLAHSFPFESAHAREASSYQGYDLDVYEFERQSSMYHEEQVFGRY